MDTHRGDISPYQSEERLLRDVCLSTSEALFRLRTWDTCRRDARGQTVIAYELTAVGTGHVLFASADFAGSPLHADDSDATLRSLIGFLSLKPGDTDPEYFEGYTDEQLAFAEQHGEELGWLAMDDTRPLGLDVVP